MLCSPANQRKRSEMPKTEIEIGTVPNKKWGEFLSKASKFAEVEVSAWKMAELIGYFCARYKEAFNKDYQLKLATASPTKAYEVFRLNTCAHRLSSNPVILKDYISWVFDQRVKIDKKTFRSIAFLTADEQLSWYREHVLFAAMGDTNIDRSTVLPPDIKEIVSSIGCNTFGDLAFIMKSGLDTDDIKVARQKLAAVGFEFGVLDKIV
jgi:hypothetical protein